MSILGSMNNSENTTMGISSTPFLHQFKKQASFYFKEKIKTARLVLTDVTPAQILTEEITTGNSTAPDTKTMGIISKAAFEVDDYWRIVDILHNKLSKFDRKNWRVSYNSIILLEHLVTHGPESAAKEFQTDKDVIKEMESFQHIDEKGFDWGLAVRKKSERVSKLLERGLLLKEERERTRKLSRGIQGFGSFTTTRPASTSGQQGILREAAIESYKRRCNSTFNDNQHDDNDSNNSNSNHEEENFSNNDENLKNQVVNEDQVLASSSNLFDVETSLKENMAPPMKSVWKSGKERKALLGEVTGKLRTDIGDDEEDHPFNESENEANTTLLATTTY